MVAPDRIVASPFQPRRHFDPEKLDELTKRDSHARNYRAADCAPVAGEFDEPRFELIAGERRLRAARAAGLTVVPVVVREVDDQRRSRCRWSRTSCARI